MDSVLHMFLLGDWCDRVYGPGCRGANFSQKKKIIMFVVWFCGGSNFRGPNSLVVPFILDLVMASGKPVVNSFRNRLFTVVWTQDCVWKNCQCVLWLLWFDVGFLVTLSLWNVLDTCGSPIKHFLLSHMALADFLATPLGVSLGQFFHIYTWQYQIWYMCLRYIRHVWIV